MAGMTRMWILGFVMALSNVWAWAQGGDVAAKLGYPQMIVFNGKIVTVDDASFGSTVGTVVQALAVRDGKILATGNNAEIRALAGPQTRSIDLKGRTVLPNFSMTHEHPTDWAFQEPRAINHALKNPDDVVIFRWLPNASPKEQLAQFEPTLREAISKAKPGQWIHISFNYGPNYEWSVEVPPMFRTSITKAYLDQLAPNNPLKVKGGFITSVLNQRAVEEVQKVHPGLEVVFGPGEAMGVDNFLKTGGGFSRFAEPDVMFQGKVPILASIHKAELEEWASWGITGFGSAPYAFGNLQALSYLDGRGELPARIGWGYIGPDFHIDTLRHLAAMTGHGTDHLWFAGAWGEIGSGCMSVQPRAGAQADACRFEPGARGREILERVIETGNRIATMHTGGDKDIDYLMDAIEEVSKKAGFTADEIRAKRHTFDHGSGAPRPDQIPRMKNLGMMASENNTYLWQRGTASGIAERYGIEYTNWVVPRASMAKGGVMSSAEIDRPLPYKVFEMMLAGMTRYHAADKQVYGAGEKTDRIIQLKAYTRWGAYYLLRENLLGTLEPGKYADFMVLDRDFLTVPEADIANIKVLMTVVGDKTEHLADSLAREVGMQPVGASTWKDPITPGW